MATRRLGDGSFERLTSDLDQFRSDIGVRVNLCRDTDCPEPGCRAGQIMAAILAEHAEMPDGDCGICGSDYDDYPLKWPCPPTLIIARILGIAPPINRS